MDQEAIQQNEDKELVIIVNEQNIEVEQAIRSKVRANNLIHRATYIFVIQEGTNKLFCHKRSHLKRYCPSYYDVCFGGVVSAGESYKDNAQRELQEEAGLKEQLIELGTFYHCSDNIKVWGQVFYTIFKGIITDLIPQPEEVEFIELLSFEQINQMISNGVLFTGDGLCALEQLRNALKLE